MSIYELFLILLNTGNQLDYIFAFVVVGDYVHLID